MKGDSYKLLVMLTVGVAYACNDAETLPNLEKRGRKYKAEKNEPFVNDLFLDTGWYRVTGSEGQYMMPNNNQSIPSGGCGTINQIYINEKAHPVVPSEAPVATVACVRGGLKSCYSTINIKIRNCSGELQYHLPTTGRFYAYCFDSPSGQGISTISAAPKDFNPGVVTILPNLAWTATIDTTTADEHDVYEPELYFECSFKENKSASLFYKVTWTVLGSRQFHKGPDTNITKLRLTSTELVKAGLYLGIELQCGVQASVDESGSLTISTFAETFFAGIQIFNQSIVLKSVQKVTIWFRSTVPIGCKHKKEENSCLTQLPIMMINSSAISICTNSAIVMRCSTDIKLLAKDEPKPPEEPMYAFNVASKSTYTEPQHFILQLGTGDDPDIEEFFKNQTLPIITVIASEEWTPKHCYSHVDPHMKTFDGTYYENQMSGDFVLYRNVKYGIEVQERTMLCNNNRAYCTCQVAVRAGASVFVMNRCPYSKPFNEFLVCEENMSLDVVKLHEKLYKINTPIGTVVEISTGHYENGSFMNVDIYSTPKDLKNVTGLCGYYDDNASNDLEMPNGIRATNRNADLQFSKSWMLHNRTGYLMQYDTFEKMATINAYMCVCNDTEKRNEASCDSLNNANCITSITPRKCLKTQSVRTMVVSRNNWKLTANWEKTKKAEKRSVYSDLPTEDEVRSQCSNIIRNAPSVTQFPDRLMGEDIDEVIEQCVFDVMAADGDISMGEIHAQSLNNVVKQSFSYEPSFFAKNTNSIQSFLQATCPNNCSGRGVCSVDGQCVCETLYHGPECELYERDPINVDFIQGEGVCDTALGDDCRCHWFYTNNLLESFSCKFRQFKVYEDSTKSYMDEFVVPGEFDDMFTGQCCLPRRRNKRSVGSDGVGYEWELAISNDGTHFGRRQTLYIIDQTCLNVVTNSSTNERSLTVKGGYCLIDFQCVADREMMLSGQCQMCSADRHRFEWTYVCEGRNEAKTVGIAVGICVGSVAVISVVILIYRKSKTRQSIRVTKKKQSLYVQDASDVLPACSEGPCKTTE